MLLQILVLLLILFIDISQAKSARLRTSSLKTNALSHPATAKWTWLRKRLRRMSKALPCPRL